MEKTKTSVSDALKNSPPPKTIGGQAVIEGVMMRGKKMYAMAVRNPNKEIEIVKKDFTPVSDKYKWLRLPILRGVVSFVDSLVMGMKIITLSAEIAMGDEENGEPYEPSKFEKFLTRTFGEKLNDILLYTSVCIALVFSVLLFILTPTWLASFIRPLLGGNTWALGVVEGLLRIFILVAYVYLISRSKDIQRVYEYHGAEHKTINCLEHGDELTVANVAKHTRLHKRCGTSFLLIVMIISMVVFFFIRTDVVWMRFGFRLLLVPVIAGLSYELIRWAGRSDSALVNIVSYPGMCLQKITTSEPADDQIEVAIAAMKEVLAHEPD